MCKRSSFYISEYCWIWQCLFTFPWFPVPGSEHSSFSTRLPTFSFLLPPNEGNAAPALQKSPRLISAGWTNLEGKVTNSYQTSNGVQVHSALQHRKPWLKLQRVCGDEWRRARSFGILVRDSRWFSQALTDLDKVEQYSYDKWLSFYKIIFKIMGMLYLISKSLYWVEMPLLLLEHYLYC